ncbi:hypothetical protein FRC20_005790 [Serendipita sp. 405]|nr:hypothetical protein FRC20_005790 [Serendipita sp. 405]
MSHTLAYREARTSLSNIVKPEPLRRLSSPPAAIAVNTSSSPRQRMRGGVVHSPANSGTGTPTRVKSPETLSQPAIRQPHQLGDNHDDGEESDSTSRRPASLSGSITSVD